MGRAAYRHKCIPTAVGAWIRRRKYPGHHSKRRTTAHSTSVSPFPQQYSPPQRGRTAYRGKRGKTYQGTSSTHRGAYSHTCRGSTATGPTACHVLGDNATSHLSSSTWGV